MMKALVARDYGPLGSLQIEDLPIPEPGHGQILVKVAAASLDPDLAARHTRGKHVVSMPGAQASRPR
jgi:NADPH:quinone reductase-like Zn-dependent oxidoreductase